VGTDSRAWAISFSDGWGADFSCIFRPMTAPARHRNVQVTAIPILCSRFIRVLLSSDGLRQSFTAARQSQAPLQAQQQGQLISS